MLRFAERNDPLLNATGTEFLGSHLLADDEAGTCGSCGKAEPVAGLDESAGAPPPVPSSDFTSGSRREGNRSIENVKGEDKSE